jgi:molecular chaperone DnaK
MAADNRSLGRFALSGIPPAPRGVPQIEVTFDIDANGILSVKAKDKATNKEQQITITASTNLSKDDVEKMKKDAEANAEADKKRRESIEVKNMAETMVYTTEKMLKEAGDKAPEADRKETEVKLEELKKAIASNDTDAMKKSADELATVAQKVGAAMYQQAQAGQAPPTDGVSQNSTEPPKDAGDAGQGPVEGDFTPKS